MSLESGLGEGLGFKIRVSLEIGIGLGIGLGIGIGLRLGESLIVCLSKRTRPILRLGSLQTKHNKLLEQAFSYTPFGLNRVISGALDQTYESDFDMR